MDERKDTFPPAVGGSSLLVIFAVLCLTIFEKLCCYLWEQCISKYIFVLFFPLAHLCLDLR